MFKRILVPVDGSPLAEAALSYATVLAKSNNAEIVLLRVVEYSSDLYSGCHEYPHTDPEFIRSLSEKKKAVQLNALRYLNHLAEQLKMQNQAVSIKIGKGPVVKAILDVVEDQGADLIVMTTHACSGLSHRMIGAIADQVMFEASVPVILVHSNLPTGTSNRSRLNSPIRAV